MPWSRPQIQGHKALLGRRKTVPHRHRARGASTRRKLLVLAGLALTVGTRVPLSKADAAPQEPPSIPDGMRPCTEPMPLPQALPHRAGEAIRYRVRLGGFELGTIDFRVEHTRVVDGQTVAEYRSRFDLAGLVSTFIAVNGRATSLVAPELGTTLKSLNTYRLARNRYVERKSFSKAGQRVRSRRTRNGKRTEAKRTFREPVRDLLTAFYMLRTLGAGDRGCTVVYDNQRAYTFWVEPEGQERVRTPIGRRPADRYGVIYGSEKSDRPLKGSVWLGKSELRLPYRAEIYGRRRLEARIEQLQLRQ